MLNRNSIKCVFEVRTVWIHVCFIENEAGRVQKWVGSRFEARTVWEVGWQGEVASVEMSLEPLNVSQWEPPNVSQTPNGSLSAAGVYSWTTHQLSCWPTPHTYNKSTQSPKVLRFQKYSESKSTQLRILISGFWFSEVSFDCGAESLIVIELDVADDWRLGCWRLRFAHINWFAFWISTSCQQTNTEYNRQIQKTNRKDITGQSSRMPEVELCPGRWVGHGHPVFVIAELGQNHQV